MTLRQVISRIEWRLSWVINKLYKTLQKEQRRHIAQYKRPFSLVHWLEARLLAACGSVLLLNILHIEATTETF